MTKPIYFTMKIALWFHFYIMGVTFFSHVTGREVSTQKVKYWLAKATTIKDHKGNKINDLNEVIAIDKGESQ